MTAEIPRVIVPGTIFTEEALDLLREEMVGTPTETQEFLLQSLTSGALEKANVSETVLEFTYQYFIGRKNTVEIAAEHIVIRQDVEHHVSRQYVDHQIKMTIKEIWLNSPEEIKTEYPLKELKTRRDFKLPKAVFYKKEVENLLNDGKKGDEILQVLGMNSSDFQDLREKAQRHYGITIPLVGDKKYLGKYGSLELEQKLKDPEASDEVLQAALKKVTQGFLLKHTGEDDSLFLPLSKIVISEGPHGHKNHAKILQEAQIPLGMVVATGQLKNGRKYAQRYYFILARDRARAEELLSQDQ